MKKSRIITAFVTAAVTASILSANASALFIAEGDKAVYDVTPTVEGKIERVHTDLGGGFGQVDDYYVDKNGKKVTGYSLLYIDNSMEGDVGANMRMMSVDKETGEIQGNYEGFTKSGKGRRYYRNGERVYGWHKIGNYWYHFDRNGYADTGRVKICGSYYTFDKKGRWLNKVSKDGIAPKDFKLSVETSYGMSAFDTDGYIYYGEDYDNKKYTKSIKFSNRDRQMFYCMLLESGFSEGKDYDFGSTYMSEFISKYSEKTEEELFSWATEPESVYTMSYTLNGKSGSVEFGYDSVQITHLDEDCFKAYRFTEGIADYRRYYLYEKYPQPKGVDWVKIE